LAKTVASKSEPEKEFVVGGGPKGKATKSPSHTPIKTLALRAESSHTPNQQSIGHHQTLTKKKTSASSNLDKTVWNRLDFSNTPKEGVRRMLMWPIITTTGIDNRRMFLSYLQGDLHPTKVSLAAQEGLTRVVTRTFSDGRTMAARASVT
jgi:hypothetical protein